AFPDGGAMSPQVSPDGSKLVYVHGEGDMGPLHLLDIDTGRDRVLARGSDGEQWSQPKFSPDGTQILAEWRLAEQYHLALLPVDGAGPVIELDPAHDAGTGGGQAEFSPDGKSVLAFYDTDGTSWLFDIAGRSGRQLDGSFAVDPDRTFAGFPGAGRAWQRLAP